MSEIVGHPLDTLLHVLWTKAVGAESYNKKEWLEFEKLIYKAIISEKEKS